ncbi:MAG: PilZ domain-containing protein [Planctomycetota bacterium]
MGGMDERRWFRYELKNCWAEYKRRGPLSFLKGPNFERYQILDLNPFGAQIAATRSFDANAFLDLQLRIPVYDEHLTVKAAVRWVVRSSDPTQKLFLIGIKFMEYGDGVKDRLKRLFQSDQMKNLRKAEKPVARTKSGAKTS